MKKTIIVMIIFVGLLTNSLLSQDKQVEGTDETANICNDAIEKNITNLDIKKASIAQSIEFFEKEKRKKFTFIIRVDYFLPTEEIFKNVYENGINYGGEITASLLKGISLYIGASLFSKTGKMIPQGEGTEINIIPIELGVLLKFSKTKIKPYVGGGVGYYSLSEESFLGKVTAANTGFFGQLGVTINLTEDFVIDIKGKYNFCDVEIDAIKNNIGGITIGGGIGLNF